MRVSRGCRGALTPASVAERSVGGVKRPGLAFAQDLAVGAGAWKWALERALDDERRRDEIVSSMGTLAAEGYEWDADPAVWFDVQRHGDADRVG